MMETLPSKVKRLKSQNRTWRDVGEEIGISGALAWKIAHGKSDSDAARHYFNMPPKVVETEPCQVCGEVHKLKRCNKQRTERRHRRAAEFSNKRRAELFDRMLSERGITLSDWMNAELDAYIVGREDRNG